MHQHSQEQRPSFLVPTEDYQLLAAELDETSLQAGFLGRWASREAFGLSLLDDTSAHERLAQLPGWLRGYVRLDGDGFAAEYEQAGLYVITKVTTGVCVFDAALVRRHK